MFAHKLFFVCFSKNTLRSPQIATFTKPQHTHCQLFTEKILSFTQQLPAPTVGYITVPPGKHAELKLILIACGLICIRGIHFTVANF